MLQQDDWDRIGEEEKKDWLGSAATQAYLKRLVVDAGMCERALMDAAQTGTVDLAFTPNIVRMAGQIRGLKLAIRYAGVK